MRFLIEWDKEATGNKVLIFSQTKKILSILEVLLKQRDIPFDRMDGDVSLKTRMDLI